MEDYDKFIQSIKQIQKLVTTIAILFMAMASILVYLYIDPTLSAFKSDEPEQEYVTVPGVNEDDFDKIENGIHLRTGFVEAEGMMEVINNCTNCHSSQLVIQNRMNEERWIATIRWMQETQNLWDLGNNEEIIVNYLVTNYPPQKKGRRATLTDIEWYELLD